MIYFIANYELEETTKATLTDLKKWLLKQKVYAIDCETAISEWVEERFPITYQFGNKYDQWVVDLRDIDISSLKSLLESEKTLKLGHNIKFDYTVFKHHSNITFENVWDTMLGEQTIYNGIDKPKGYYSLESTHGRYYNSNPYGDQLSFLDPFIPKKTRNEISKKDNQPLSYAEVFYAAMDIRVTYAVYELQKEVLAENNLLETQQLKNEFTLVLGDCELNGMPIDSAEWLKLSEWSKTRLKEQESILNKIYPSVANWNSHIQVKKLFKELGIPIKYQDKDSISELVIKEHADKFPIITEYLKYKRYGKLTSTYGVKFLDHVNPHTNRIHSSFLQLPVTGRVSSTSPNLQNLPQTKSDFLEAKWWRESFRTTSGYGFTIADYSQQELRILASISGDKELATIFREHRDPHTEAAAALYNVPIEQVTPEQRKNAKTFNFAVAYGTGAYKLSKTFGISVRAAQTLIDNYFNRFSSLREFQEQTYQDALKVGYIVTNSIGSRAHIPNWDYYQALKNLQSYIDPDYAKEYKKLSGEIFRTCCNYLIQSEAAVIAKRAGILLRNHLKKHPNEFKILLLEHDCWIVENLSPNAKDVVERCMREAALQYCSIEIPAEGLVTNKWSK